MNESWMQDWRYLAFALTLSCVVINVRKNPDSQIKPPGLRQIYYLDSLHLPCHRVCRRV